MSDKYETVNHPAHYNQIAGVECIDVVEWLSFNIGCAMKYLWRVGQKPGVSAQEDLLKAKWYIEREMQRLSTLTEDDNEGSVDGVGAALPQDPDEGAWISPEFVTLGSDASIWKAMRPGEGLKLGAGFEGEIVRVLEVDKDRKRVRIRKLRNGEPPVYVYWCSSWKGDEL